MLEEARGACAELRVLVALQRIQALQRLGLHNLPIAGGGESLSSLQCGPMRAGGQCGWMGAHRIAVLRHVEHALRPAVEHALVDQGERVQRVMQILSAPISVSGAKGKRERKKAFKAARRNAEEERQLAEREAREEALRQKGRDEVSQRKAAAAAAAAARGDR